LSIGEDTRNLVWIQNFRESIQKPLDSKRNYAAGLVLFSDQDELFGEVLFQQMFKDESWQEITYS